MRTLLIDGDIIAFTVAARVETCIDWGDGEKTIVADEETAKAEAQKWIDELVEKLDADDAIIAMSDPGRRYFRHDLWPTYKDGRTHGRTPLLLSAMKAFLRNEPFKSKCKPMLEADDVLGIMATHPTMVPGEKIVVTADKDLKQIPGLHFNPRLPKAEVEEVTEAQADEFFYEQALTGDPTDKYPGCPRIGVVNAKRILSAAHEAAAMHRYTDGFDHYHAMTWAAIVATYAAKGKDEAYALTQARVARILRTSDYDFDRKVPILWTPTRPS